MITKRGAEALHKVQTGQDEDGLKRKKEKEYFDTYFHYANNHICPQCGEKRPKKEIKIWIDGEYGPMYFYIDCSLCGCKESNIEDIEDIKRAQKYFSQFDGDKNG